MSRAQDEATHRPSSLQPAVQSVMLQPGILDQLQDAVFTTDLQGIVTSYNQGAERYGVAPKEQDRQ